jgi:cytochrome c oxidase subunit 1
MPDRSWCPLITGAGLLILILGMLFRKSNEVSESFFMTPYEIAIGGGVIFVVGIILWAMEGPGGYHLFPEEDDE